jgi:hypothetical protein
MLNVKEHARKAQTLTSLKPSTNELHDITPNSAILLILQISEDCLLRGHGLQLLIHPQGFGVRCRYFF